MAYFFIFLAVFSPFSFGLESEEFGFFDLQVGKLEDIVESPKIGISQYLGFNMGVGTGLASTPFLHNIHAQLNLLYMLKSPGLWAVGFALEGGVDYARVTQPSFEGDRLGDLSFIMSPILRVYMGSPFYLGVGLGIGFNLGHMGGSERLLFYGGQASIGYLLEQKGVAFDFSLKWSYFPPNASISSLLVGKKRSVQGVSLLFGVYGVFN